MITDEMFTQFIQKYDGDTRGLDVDAVERALEAVAPMIRAQALEEAAQVADLWATDHQRQFGDGGPAAAIRAMKEGKP